MRWKLEAIALSFAEREEAFGVDGGRFTGWFVRGRRGPSAAGVVRSWAAVCLVFLVFESPWIGGIDASSLFLALGTSNATLLIVRDSLQVGYDLGASMPLPAPQHNPPSTWTPDPPHQPIPSQWPGSHKNQFCCTFWICGTWLRCHRWRCWVVLYASKE